MDSKPVSSWPRWVLIAPLVLIGLASVKWVKGVLPPCLFRQVTGWYCPGCGATRASESLVDFRWLEALQQNAFWSLLVLLGLPLMLLSAARERFPQVGWLRPFRRRIWFLWVVLGALFVFALTRNLPGFECLAPR